LGVRSRASVLCAQVSVEVFDIVNQFVLLFFKWASLQTAFSLVTGGLSSNLALLPAMLRRICHYFSHAVTALRL
jgi:hypothetical protein